MTADGRHLETAAEAQARRGRGWADPAEGLQEPRLRFIGGLFAAAFAVVALRLFDIALVSDVPAAPAIAAGSGGPAAEARRADITDRNGILLATSITAPSLFADPARLTDPVGTARRLARILPDLDAAALADRLRQPGRRFVWVRRNLTPGQKYAVNRLGVPGLHFRDEEHRLYPQGRLTAHIVGYTDIEAAGIAGIEKGLDRRLREESEPLRLSIDVRVQHQLRRALERQIAAFRASAAVGIVLDVRNGELRAMVSLPDFDPNHLAGTPDRHLFNRATLGVYEMGSTFKVFNTAMGFDRAGIRLRDRYDATEPLRFAGHTIHDYHPQRRWLNVAEILAHSSNIGSARMAHAAGTPAQRRFLGDLGLLERLDIELPERGAPIAPRIWRQINTMTIGFGHGLAVSPLHLANGVATIVNGGMRRPVTLLAGGNAGVAGKRVVSAKVSRLMRRLLRLAAMRGTSANGAAPGYLIGGKTGTAEKTRSGGGYRARALLSSFVAAFPIHQPRYVVLAMIDEPKGNARTGRPTGGVAAAPVVRTVIERTATLLGVRPVDEEAPEIQRVLRLNLPEPTGEKRLASF